MSALGGGLVAFWVSVALVIVTLLGAFGWLVVLSMARDSHRVTKERKDLWRRFDAQQHRLRELRNLNSRLVDRIRDTEPKRNKS
jgi:hypothetical protein